MRKLKLSVMFILSLFLIGVIGGSVAYRGYINEFEGAGHGGCHGSSDTEASATGDITLTRVPSGNLETDEEFVLTVVVTDFMEPYEETDSYNSNMIVGLSGELGNNSEFMRNLDGAIFWTGEVDTNGDADEHLSYGQSPGEGVPFEFELIAPSTAGTYILTVSAIAGSNHTGGSHGAYPPFNITYINKNISITVVAPVAGGGDPGTIPGGILAITIGSVFVVTTIIILKKKNILKKK